MSEAVHSRGVEDESWQTTCTRRCKPDVSLCRSQLRDAQGPHGPLVADVDFVRSNINRPVLYLCPWDDEIAAREGTLHVCGELCAQRLQSQFMGNVRENQRSASV